MAAAAWSRCIAAFIRLSRLPFLAGGFVFHGLGAAMAGYAGAPLDLAVFAWGQVAITTAQLMTHYANEYFDLAADRANPTPTRWSGGSRVLPAGELAPGVALAMALIMGLVALGATAALAWGLRAGPLAPPLLLLSIALAWSYSGPPLRLQARGLGGIVAALVVPGLTPLVGFTLQAGAISRLPLLSALPLCGLQFAMLLIIDIPDAAGDAAADKRTPAVRLGARAVAWLHNLTLLTTYAALPLLALAGMPPLAAGAAALGAPLALWQAWRVRRGDWAKPAKWDGLAFGSVALLIGTSVAELVTFVLMHSLV